MISHVTMRHMVPVSSPADVKNKLAVMKRFNADHARDPARNCAFTDAHLVTAVFAGGPLDALVDGPSAERGWVRRDSPANPFKFESGDKLSALEFEWIVHNELSDDPEDSSRETLRALGGAVLKCNGFEIHRSEKVTGDLLTDALAVEALEAVTAKRNTRSAAAWV